MLNGPLQHFSNTILSSSHLQLQSPHPFTPPLQLANRINITDLPQMVAAFHSLVGFAAAATAIATVLASASTTGAEGEVLDGVHRVTAYLGDIIGAITLTG